MPTFPAAQFTIDDVEVVAVLLDSSFDGRTAEQRLTLHAQLENSAVDAGLAGNVVAVWRDPEGRTRFLAPPEQHSFFQIVRYTQLLAQVNRTLECG